MFGVFAPQAHLNGGQALGPASPSEEDLPPSLTSQARATATQGELMRLLQPKSHLSRQGAF